MARKPTGAVLEHEAKDGLVYRSLRFTAYGKRRYLSLGSVTHDQAERELRHVLADVERGTWQPSTTVDTPAEAEPVPTFHEYAEQWWVEHEREWAPKTRVDYRWRLEQYLLPFFADHSLTAITIAEVDRYKARTLGDGKLGPGSVNKTLVLLSAILETAEERELIPRNPARGRRRRVRVRQSARTYLDTAGQLEALLAAAGELDREAADHPQVEKRLVARRAIVATLALGGLRIGELCALRWRDVDLAAGRLRVNDSKTDAGRRDVRLLAALRSELAALKASAPAERAAADAYVFATATGGKPSADNLRRRVLGKAIARADANLAGAEESPLPEGLTPHSLRRTFASVLYALGENPAEVMAQLGHTHPALALRLYARAMRLGQAEKGRLRALVDGAEVAVIGSREEGGTVTPVTAKAA